MFYIYFLFSESSNQFYVGDTQSPKERLWKHNNQDNFNTFTKKLRLWRMAALFEVSDDKKQSILIERFIKKQKSRKLLEKLCEENFKPNGALAQLVRVPHPV